MLFLKAKNEYNNTIRINMMHVVKFYYNSFEETTTFVLTDGSRVTVNGDITEPKEDDFFCLKEN